MVNTYGYNRKTKEEDEAILAAVRRHHDIVAAKGYLIVFTSLVGSQNYDLDDKNSDIDTFSFVYPPLSDLALGKDLSSEMFEVEDGHCEIKDIRIALRLLKKASPNSVEYFTSKYKIYNPIFEPLLTEYLNDNTKLWNMVHCNYEHMLTAIVGMVYQLTKRNMSAGKRAAHALRLDNMMYHFLNSNNAGAILDMRTGGDRDYALLIKRDTDITHEKEYNEQTDSIALRLDKIKEDFIITEKQLYIQQYGLSLIDSLQWKLFKKYLEEVNK